MYDHARSKPNIDFVTNAVVTEVIGTDLGKVEGVRLHDTITGEERELEADGLFVAIGHDPTTGLFKGVLDMDEAGYLLTSDGSTATKIPGVFAAGDVVDHVYRQAVTAAGMGCMAALDAERWLAHAGKAEAAPAEAVAQPEHYSSVNQARRRLPPLAQQRLSEVDAGLHGDELVDDSAQRRRVLRQVVVDPQHLEAGIEPARRNRGA